MKKNVLITGASRGLGNDLTAAYLRKGVRVFACARDVGSSKLLVLKDKYGDSLQIIEMDISDTLSVQTAAKHVRSLTDSLDILINNAGMHADDSFKVLEEISVDNCLETYNINTLGALRVTKELVRLLENESAGTIANISSESGSITNCQREKEFDYCMSKVALNMQSVLLQNYLKSRNIKVLAIHPGWFRSDMGGPDAHLAVADAAEGVISLIERFGNDLAGPVFIDYNSNVMEY